MGDKTYFIMNSTDYAPDDLIEVGQLVANPRLPYRRIVPPLRTSPSFPQLHQHPRKAWSYEASSAVSGEVGLFATFLNLLTARLGGHASASSLRAWNATELQTRFIEMGEDDSYAKDIVAVQVVQDWLKANKRFGKTVYMVTGVKVAMRPGHALDASGRGAGASGALAADVSGTGSAAAAAGGQGSFNREAGAVQQGTPGDFVFAYRLRMVYITWRNKVRLGDDLGGADLHGAGPGAGAGWREPEPEPEQRDARGGDEEIEDALLERDDFGYTLPDDDEKLAAVDEDDGEECLAIIVEAE